MNFSDYIRLIETASLALLSLCVACSAMRATLCGSFHIMKAMQASFRVYIREYRFISKLKL